MGIDGLENIYNSNFFRRWGRLNKPYVESAGLIAKELNQRFRPTRIIDVGCGCGVYGHHFQRLGVDVVFLDGVTPPEQYSFPMQIQVRDLTDPFDNVWGEFDLALCFDVGEHIPEAMSDTFLANLANLSNTILMACAPPGQGGVHHVNEQPKRYWIRRMKEHGFTYNRRSTGKLCESFKLIKPPMMWMWEHISVYERTSQINTQGGKANGNQLA